jgi:glucose-6-phosphate isomerase, archaeal
MTLPTGAAIPRVDFRTGVLSGTAIEQVVRTIADLKGTFRDEKSREALDPATPVYRVQSYFPVQEGTEGGLFWGATFIEPGMVGDEYFMTRGHFHAKRGRGEYYIALAGHGALILMDEERRTWFEPMTPGSVHYIPGRVAHRAANTGKEVFSFVACWPSDAGHDYETIASHGFGARLRNIGGTAVLAEDL